MRLPSITSMSSSAVASQLMRTWVRGTDEGVGRRHRMVTVSVRVGVGPRLCLNIGRRRIDVHAHVSGDYAILLEDRRDGLIVQVSELARRRNVQPAALFLLDRDGRWRLVESNTNAL